MRVLPALLLLAAFVGIKANIRRPDPSWAVEVKPDPTSRRLRSNSLIKANEDVVCTSNKIFSCSDCKTATVCRPKDDGTLIHYSDIPCPTDRPFCDSTSGTCSTVASLNCGDTEDSFICLEKKQFFPDAECTQFHYCDKTYTPRKFKCITDGNVYNAAEQRCVPQTDSSSCGKFECDGNTLKKMKHTNFPRYYAMCKKDENADSPLVVGVCPPYYQIGLTSQVCEPDCNAHGNGNIPDATDCTKYYACKETKLPDGSYYMQKDSKTCLPDSSFDSTLFMCVPDPNHTICPQK
ncbi:uncharacterized protein [Halyomorpha halys]|uniref:uncharacterized protein n=1 Tax=Halyomorpha halys TaxID=286706 RepID=UPI0006D4ED60|nr:uncharacterized protein LOC106692576 [Halyomorpha halys]